MKLIQAMKKLKDLKAKVDDLKEKVSRHCADLNIATATYPDQKRQVSEWLQAQHDILKEMLSLRVGIQRTNLGTHVSIELDGRHVSKSIAEWIHRRRDLALMERDMWQALTDRNLKEQDLQTMPGGPITQVRIVRYFDPVERDKMVSLYRSEPSVIDAALEIANATTELIEG